jgi:hypothetical protein
MAQSLLFNAVDATETAVAATAVCGMGFHPNAIPHCKPAKA